MMSTAELLLLFAEWLDSEGLMIPPDADDQRSHEDLAGDFLTAYEKEITQ